MSELKVGDECVIIKAGDNIWAWAAGKKAVITKINTRNSAYCECYLPDFGYADKDNRRLLPINELRKLTKLEKALK